MDSSQANEIAFPQSGRLAAVDYGTVRMGIAICDPGRILASPWEVVIRQNPQQETAYFQQLVRQQDVGGFVVGLPIHCDGNESEKSRESRQFARWLRQQTGCPVRLFDERFTTSDANKRLRDKKKSAAHRKARLDAVAAQILLEAFLEATRFCPPGQIPGYALDQPLRSGQALEDPPPSQQD